MPGDRRSGGGGESEQTLETQFTDLYFDALRSLQKIWLGDQEFNPKKFNMQILFLTRLMPDKKKQIAVLKKWDTAIEDLKSVKNLEQDEIKFFSGMEVVTDVVMYIGQAFDIINEDIVAPATSKQYRRIELEIPEQGEMNEEVVQA